MIGTNKQGQRGARHQIVKNKQHLKKVLIAVTLALVGLVVYTLVAGYTYQAKQRVELQNSLHQLQAEKVKSAEDKKKIEELTKQLQAKREAATALAEAQAQEQKAAVTRVQAHVAVSSPQCEQWMAQAGIPLTNATRTLILNESGCRYNAVNPNSGACGIPQALPCSKLGCPLSEEGAVCQLRWMNNYVAAYGGWDAALNFWHCIGNCYSTRTNSVVIKRTTWY